eukprot:2863593-Amphidinium_carterae.1
MEAGFPVCFVTMAILMDELGSWTKIMLCNSLLALGKGFAPSSRTHRGGVNVRCLPSCGKHACIIALQYAEASCSMPLALASLFWRRLL